MPYPAFIAEIATPRNRPQLWVGVWSGYAVVGLFLAVALIAHGLGVIPWSATFYALLGVKLLTNSGLWWALRRDAGVLELSGLNVMTDLLLMTAAIYLTGGPLSPLFAIYVIEIGIIALLTNLGVTLLTAAVALALYTALNIGLATELLTPVPPPIGTTAVLTAAEVIADLGIAAILLGVPTFFTGAILGKLRAKEAALAANTRRLVEASEAKARFMATVTHELRTPMHGILGLSELLEEGVYGAVTAEQGKAIHDIRRSTRQLQQLVDDLLELTRADAGRMEVRPTEVAAGDLIEQVLASARWMLEAKEALSLERQLAPGLPRLRTDARLVARILLNLLSNAVKFTPEGGRITVRAQVDAAADALVIEVEDTGIGIPPDQRERIFETFGQVDDSVERAYGGVGLGLALVRKLTSALGGSVALRSEVGVGSCFSVRLPLRPPAAKAPAPSHPRDPRPPSP